MAPDVPLLERLAQLPPVPAAEAAALVERLVPPQGDPVVGPLFGYVGHFRVSYVDTRQTPVPAAVKPLRENPSD